MVSQNSKSFHRLDITTKRQYILSQKTLKEKLNIKGDIKDIGLWEGRLPKDMEEGLTADDEKYIIIEIEEVNQDTSQD